MTSIIGTAVYGTACTVCERSVNTKIGDKHLISVYLLLNCGIIPTPMDFIPRNVIQHLSL